MLDFYKVNRVYEICQIQWWLNKNWEKYRDLKDVWECAKCPTNLGLPCICEQPDEEYLFFKVYEKLDEVSRFHKREEYFKDEITTYHKIKNSKKDLIKWVSKNEKFGTDDYLSFPYRDDDKEIRIFAYPLIINWTIDNNDFKYTIEFLEVFKILFWHEELLPESIEKMFKETHDSNPINNINIDNSVKEVSKYGDDKMAPHEQERAKVIFEVLQSINTNPYIITDFGESKFQEMIDKEFAFEAFKYGMWRLNDKSLADEYFQIPAYIKVNKDKFISDFNSKVNSGYFLDFDEKDVNIYFLNWILKFRDDAIFINELFSGK